MVAGGRLPAGEVGPMQVHQGDEVPRVRSGQILIRCRDQRRTWREGAPVVVAPGVAHGFRAVTETVPGVVAEADTGTLYPGVSDGGEAELAEPYRGGGALGGAPPARVRKGRGLVVRQRAGTAPQGIRAWFTAFRPGRGTRTPALACTGFRGRRASQPRRR